MAAGAASVPGAPETADEVEKSAQPDRAKGAPTPPAPPAAPKADVSKLVDRLRETLAALETALDSQQLAQAEAHFEALGPLQAQIGAAARTFSGRIVRAKETLTRMRSLRRWSSRQSLENLCETADALASSTFTPKELSDAVKVLRDKWQELTRQEGAPRALWGRFDAACERAWKPFREQQEAHAAVREANRIRREKILQTLEEAVAALKQPPVEWSALARTMGEQARRWRVPGPVDRKLARSFEERFEQAQKSLSQALQRVRQAETLAREELIKQATKLGSQPESRDTTEKIRGLQSSWQERAGVTVLEPEQERSLHERFRAACDQIFQARDVKRKAENEERDAWKKASQEAARKRVAGWRALCEMVQACAQFEAELARAAAAGVHTVAETRVAAQAEIRQAIDTCRDLDQPVSPALAARCERLMALSDDSAAQSADSEKFAELRGWLLQETLELEIALNLPSPAEVAADRRAVQLKLLASALGAGRYGAERDEERARALAAVVHPCPDGALQQRLNAVLAALAPKK